MKRRTGGLKQRGKVWYCRWTVNGHVNERSLRNPDGTPCTNKRDAEKARAILMAPFTVGDEVSALESLTGRLEGRRAELARLEEERNPPLAIASAWTSYRDSPARPDSGPQTLADYESHFAQFAEWIGEQHPEAKLLRDVTRAIAEAYASHLTRRGLSGNRFNKHLGFLSLCWRVLRDPARLDGNPWADIPRKRQAPNTRRELTVDELRRAFDAASGELQTLLAIGTFTGLRLHDACCLRWAEVDLDRAIIRKVPAKVARRNPRPVLIPLHPFLASRLADIPADERHEYVLPAMAALYEKGQSEVAKVIRRHFESCGITVHKPGTGYELKADGEGHPVRQHSGRRAVVEVGFHSLRHSFVLICRAANAPLAVVQSIVGHSSPALTNYYTHTGEDAARAAIAALPAFTTEAPPTDTAPVVEAPSLEEIRTALEGMTPDNWQAIRDELLGRLA